jgi:glycerol-3-phosphate dehydrogenase
MAEDTVNHAITLGKLEDRKCVTGELRIHGYDPSYEQQGEMSVYGTDAARITALASQTPELAKQLHPDLPYIAAEVVWAVREEMARELEDVLARRTRALFLNAHAAIEMAPEAVALMAIELGKDQGWQDAQLKSFRDLAKQYTLERSNFEEAEVAGTHKAS